eukprot:CAMPEP_0202868934 /NCGR_PEP_ID=MMETSP1391-20130828/11421_1 /ASSEMBLY_ACC=CAM_ASM_000867 /TAXON_ID=1034604 /ORGANISM="Chlamydomonas leiostraca, Strain SAG 11-49" /LENGTH=379 /DNA_ID=CAMNT_0049549165 /DNA_START=294 /DNA_END=1432 /DNA_ORIENTATION=-
MLRRACQLLDLEDDSVYDGVIADVPTKPSSLYVRVRGMLKHFQTTKGVFKAVDGVDVDIEPSTIVALLGPSGSGKTTLLRLIAGLESPTGGKILFDDFDATNTPVQDRQIGMVFQSYALFNHMTVAENIKFGLQMRKLTIDHDKRVADLLELVQLEGLGDRFPRQLSGGQRQRVALARSLASNPRLLLLDEPFGALDAVVRKSLRAGLREIVRSVGVTTIIVTHDQEEAFDLADKVVVFNRGRIEQQGTPNEIIKRPRTPFIMKFVGDTNMVPASAQLLRKINFHTAKAQAMFRPSDMTVTRTADARSAPAVVAERHNLGWTIKYTLRFDDDVEVEYNVTRDQDEKQYNMAVNERVYVYVSPDVVMGFNMDEIDSAPKL